MKTNNFFRFLVLGVLTTASVLSANAQSTEELTFRNDSVLLSGTLSLPSQKGPFPLVIFVHGDGPIDRTSGGYFNEIIVELNKIGVACFSWDKPGVGKSSGVK